MSEEPQADITATIASDEINTDYANNIAIHPTVWDLKIVFGEYSNTLNTVEWHTSMTMPYATAKLLAYYLQMNVELYEIYNGRVALPTGSLPAAPPPVPTQQDGTIDPKAKEIFETLQILHKRLMDSLAVAQKQ